MSLEESTVSARALALTEFDIYCERSAVKGPSSPGKFLLCPRVVTSGPIVR